MPLPTPEEIAQLQAYADQFKADMAGPTAVQPGGGAGLPADYDPTKDPEIDALQAYAHQMGLMPGGPSAVQDALDRSNQPVEDLSGAGGGTAHLGLNLALPMSDADRAAQVAAHAKGTGPGGNLSTMGPSWAPNAAAKDQAVIRPPPPPPPTDPREHQDPKAFNQQHPLQVMDKDAFDAKFNAPTPDAGAPDIVDTMFPVVGGAAGGAGGPMVIKGGRTSVLTPQGEQAFTEGAEDRLKALDDQDPKKYIDAQRAAIDAATKARNEAYLNEKAVLDGQIAAQQAKAHQLAQAEAQADATAKAAADEVTNSEVDPERFFHSRSTFQSIALALGVGAGAFGQALGGGPNRAWDMIQSSINQDIDAQKVNLAKKQRSADSALARAKDATGSLDQAEQIVRIQQLTAAQQQTAQLMAAAGDEQQKARLMEIEQKINAGLLDAKGALKESYAITDAQLHPMTPDRVIGGGGGAAAGAATKLAGDVVNVPDGNGGWNAFVVKNEKARDEILDESAKFATVQNIYGQMKQYLDKGGLNWRTDPTSQAAITSLRGQILSIGKRATGESSDNDWDHLVDQAGDPKAWLADGAKIMKQYIDNKRIAVLNRVKAANGYPAQAVTARDNSGALLPGAVVTGATTPSTGQKPPGFKDQPK